MTVFWVGHARAQSLVPTDVYQTLMYSATGNISVSPPPPSTPFTLSGALPAIFGVTGKPANCTLPNPAPGCFATKNSFTTFDATLSASIATALSTIPIASPASAVITKTDPATGAELPASSTLGPIFTERAESVGKHKFYIGISNQDFHFTSFNGQSLNNLTLLDKGGVQSSLG